MSWVHLLWINVLLVLFHLTMLDTAVRKERTIKCHAPKLLRKEYKLITVEELYSAVWMRCDFYSNCNCL